MNSILKRVWFTPVSFCVELFSIMSTYGEQGHTIKFCWCLSKSAGETYALYNKHILMKIGLLGQPYSNGTLFFSTRESPALLPYPGRKLSFKNNSQHGSIYYLWWLTHITKGFRTCLRCLKNFFVFSYFFFFWSSNKIGKTYRGSTSFQTIIA